MCTLYTNASLSHSLLIITTRGADSIAKLHKRIGCFTDEPRMPNLKDIWSMLQNASSHSMPNMLSMIDKLLLLLLLPLLLFRTCWMQSSTSSRSLPGSQLS
jgi:hypothetical protein